MKGDRDWERESGGGTAEGDKFLGKWRVVRELQRVVTSPRGWEVDSSNKCLRKNRML